jgi:radical SAM superfamily enzyme YgiQ (UPF0313 family)
MGRELSNFCEHARPAAADAIDPQALAGKSVLLINPPWHLRSGNLWKPIASCYPSLALATLAAYLERFGAAVEIVDMQAQGGTLEQIASSHPDVVGITATTVVAAQAHAVARQARRSWPAAMIVMGGVHPTVAPAETLEDPAVDIVIRGEGELSLLRLIAGHDPRTIPGVVFREGGQVWQHPELDAITDLDALPMPAYHLLPMRLYHPPLGGALRWPSISMVTSRGCPGRCTYCNSARSRKLRFRSAEKVVQEVELLTRRFGIREVGFYDDTFCANRRRVREICRLLRQREISITWTCMSRINYADPETLALMAAAGCHMICYGVESASPDVLLRIRKNLDLDQVAPVVRMTRRVGIRVRLSFMFGNPGETVETMERSIRFAIAADPDLVQFNITTPYPGTEMFEWADREGYLVTKDWSRYDLSNMVMKLPTVSEREIRRSFRVGYRSFYLRPRFFARQLRGLLRWPEQLLLVPRQLSTMVTRMGR